MSTLIVTAHPDADSLTHRAAQRVGELLEEPPAFAHLAQEGFDPRFTLNDRHVYRGAGEPDAEVLAEQQRIAGATQLVLVFPVYWWSMPALLKGWVDRVFIAPWAFDYDDDDKVVPKLQSVTAHLLPVSGTEAESFARHGYTASFGTQVEAGIIDFCGLQRGATAFLHDSDSTDEAVVGAALEVAAATVAAAITGTAS